MNILSWFNSESETLSRDNGEGGSGGGERRNPDMGQKDIAIETDPEKVDFEGVVIRRDADGYGVVELHLSSEPSPPEPAYGFFTRDVVLHPNVDRICVTGNKIHGRAERYGDGFRILRIDPKLVLG